MKEEELKKEVKQRLLQPTDLDIEYYRQELKRCYNLLQIANMRERQRVEKIVYERFKNDDFPYKGNQIIIIIDELLKQKLNKGEGKL